MVLIRSTPSRSAGNSHHRTEPGRRLRFMLAFGLSILLCLSSIPLGVSAQQVEAIAEPDVLLALKADPLLQTVWRSQRYEIHSTDGRGDGQAFRYQHESGLERRLTRWHDGSGKGD